MYVAAFTSKCANNKVFGKLWILSVYLNVGLTSRLYTRDAKEFRRTFAVLAAAWCSKIRRERCDPVRTAVITCDFG